MSLATHSGWRQAHVNPPLPVLLMHFDGGWVDETGISTWTPHGTFAFETADTPGFGQQISTGSGVGAFATSSQDLSIGTRLFTLEGRCRFDGGEGGGILLAKNYISSEPGPGVFTLDFGFTMRPGSMVVSWTTGPSQSDSRELSWPSWAPGEMIPWAVTDDGILLRGYQNGVLVDTAPSMIAATIPPPVTPQMRLTLFNALQGFAGPAPDWGGSFFVGRLDELRFTLDHALYTGDSYVPASRPFSYRP